MSIVDNPISAIVEGMARVIKRRVDLGWSLEDHHLIEALKRAGFYAAEITDHFDAAKAAALGETDSNEL